MFRFQTPWCKVKGVISRPVMPQTRKLAAPPMRRRGDGHRQVDLYARWRRHHCGIVGARYQPFAYSPGFYFYFDFQILVLAQILAEATEELEEASQHSPVSQGVTEQFVNR